MLIDNENKLRCKKCIGKKYIEGLGMMQIICPECEGKGFTDKLAEKTEESDDEKERKKPGRKPKFDY